MSNLKTIAHNIRTQDNRATSDPLFLVQQKGRTWGVDMAYTDTYEWVGTDDCELRPTPQQRLEFQRSGPNGDDIWDCVGYVDHWEFVTACFTESGCRDYIRANAHNLNEPRVYCVSLYRNDEMIAVREMIIDEDETK